MEASGTRRVYQSGCIYPHHLLFALGLFKVLIMSPLMGDLGSFVVTCGKYYISTSNVHVFSLSRNWCHLPRIRPYCPCGHLRFKSTGSPQEKKKKIFKWSMEREELLRPLIVLCNHGSTPQNKQKNKKLKKNMDWFVILFWFQSLFCFIHARTMRRLLNTC